MDRGVLVASDEGQEWLLPWWWGNYCEHNTLPVAFADFGMSEGGRAWCKARGELVEVAFGGLRVAKRGEIEPAVVAEWENCLSPFWGSRGAWFKKPFALLQSPFAETIWTDLDCEILGNLEGMYRYIDAESKMGLVRVRDPESEGDFVLYNSGVIAFGRESKLLKRWSEAALFRNDQFLSDQDALSQIIFEEKCSVGEAPEIYNWLMCRGVRLGAVVLHWAAMWGKEYIRKYGGLKHELRNL
ncbi:MAG: hypothetical protein WCF19_02900 [Chlamydiales bacterium]